MSIRVKRAAAGVLAPVGLFRLCGALKARVTQQLVLLGYHRVVPPLELGSSHSGDLELVSATPSEFAWQMEYLARRFEPVSFEQIADALDGVRALPKRAIAVTFDDGFADVYDHAFPVLQRARMPATVFVSTGYVDEPQPFWFDLVAWIIMHAPARAVNVPTSEEPLPAEDSEPARRAAIVKVLRWLKRCDDGVRYAAVAALSVQFPEASAAGSKALSRALSWPQVREMAAGGIEFGSHTVSHRSLSKLQPGELDHELVMSKARLEAELRTRVTALAYPFGGHAAFNGNVIAAARKAGYRVATSYIPGVNAPSPENRFALRRQHVERDTSRSYFEALVNAPEVFD
jgi:peptidoglycan/xylan/chitin deacetylase (PgdA/CDA1 family)